MRELTPETILFHNTYRIVRMLGRGGMGAVYEARHTRLGHTIALKETFYSSDDRQMIDAFFREAQFLAHLAHPALPKVSDFFKENDSHFIVMEFIAGENLRKLLADRGGPFPCEQVLVWADQLLAVLEYLHGQPVPIIHRDIKPENLKLTSEGKIVLLDFGLAKRHAPGVSQSVHALTKLYAPLEQFQGVSTDQRSDIFSLGATLYHLMTCEEPINAEVRHEIVKQGVTDTLRAVHQVQTVVPESVSTVIRKAMALKPEDRFQSVTEFREALRKAGQTKSSAQKVVIPLSPPPPPPAPVIVSPNPENSVLEELKKLFGGFGPKPEPPPPQKQAEPQPRVQFPPFFTNSLGMEFVLIQAGEFQMGSNNGGENEKPVHQVRISQPFYLGKYQVTQAQWQAVMRTNPSYFKGDRLPVESVSWKDCQEFIQMLNVKGEGSYRLPTEAEWEYACRAGTTGDYAGNLDEMGWYGNNSGRQRIDAQTLWATDSSKYLDALLANGCQTHPVGQKKPNGWGLYDMHGNVWEWCEDWYDSGYYAKSPGSDPKGPSGGSFRVLRGGGWSGTAVVCRSARRYYYLPGNRYHALGFRLVRTAR